jgi:hypothetical protein
MSSIKRQVLPDPHGMIARVRARLNKKCAIRQSPFCDVIISMRLQAIPFRDIEKWLIEQGQEYRISSPTIFRNFKQSKIQVNLTWAEEMLENLGGQVNIDIIREMSQNIYMQKQRVDALVRVEQEKRKSNPAFSDKRIRQELTIQNDMLTKLHAMLVKIPGEATNKMEEDIKKMEKEGIGLTEDAAHVLTDLIINGDIVIGLNDLLPSPTTRH